MEQAAAAAYIAQEDGNKAVLEINIPAENSWNAKVNRPICTPNSLQTDLSTNQCYVVLWLYTNLK